MASATKTLFAVALLLLMLMDTGYCEEKKGICKLLDMVLNRNETEAIEPLEGATSVSKTELTGYFKVIVIGTGKACYVKEIRYTGENSEEFGEWASSEAFINFFGEPECEEGDVGIAWGKIRASVVAAAYEKGEECLARVLSSVNKNPFCQFRWGEVRARISGEAEGEALALCET